MPRSKWWMMTPGPAGAASVGGGGTITTFQITAQVTATVPFAIGLAIKKGDIPNGQVPNLDVANYQSSVLSRWNDSSAKHVIVAGRKSVTSGVASTITVTAGSAPGGTALTSSDIQTAAPSASIQCGSIGTVNLSSLLASPTRTYISGPEMVECHYESAVGADTSLHIRFEVQLYADGRIRVREVVKNGYLNVTGVTKTYVPTLSINGSTVYNNGGASLSHYAHTQYSAEAWIGTDPQINHVQAIPYFKTTKLIPNYGSFGAPSAGTLNGLTQTYTQMGSADWTVEMGGPGFQNQIGLLPNWDALYVTSDGDSRAFKSVLANSKAINSYPIIWDDSNTNLPVKPSDRSTWTVEGAGGGGATEQVAGTLHWDTAHHGSAGYLAYIITGEYYYLETMKNQAAMCYLMQTSANGSSTARIFTQQTRTVAWSLRTVGQLAGIAPTSDAIADEYRTLLSSNISHWDSERTQAGMNTIGQYYNYEIGVYSPINGHSGVIAPWMHNFWAQTLGLLSDIEALSSLTTLNAVRDFLYQWTVGLFGPTNDTSKYGFTRAGEFNVAISGSASSDPTTWDDNFGGTGAGDPGVWWRTFNTSNNGGGNTLLGSSGSDPVVAATGQWGIALSALAYAVDHAATGASAGRTRVLGASNYTDISGSGFDNTPIWSIVPR